MLSVLNITLSLDSFLSGPLMHLSEWAAEPLHFGVLNIQVMPGNKSIHMHTYTLVDMLPNENEQMDETFLLPTKLLFCDTSVWLVMGLQSWALYALRFLACSWLQDSYLSTVTHFRHVTIFCFVGRRLHPCRVQSGWSVDHRLRSDEVLTCQKFMTHAFAVEAEPWADCPMTVPSFFLTAPVPGDKRDIWNCSIANVRYRY